jgi:imidazolonepropionase-like amidohydrolase
MRHPSCFLVSFVVGLFLANFAVAQQPSRMKETRTVATAVAIKGGKLLTISHGTIENGVVVIENGKIITVGPAASTQIPAGARVIDASGMTVYPGLIDSETHLGLTEISAVASTNDLVETSDEIMPHMHVADAFHAESDLIPTTRVNGITNAIVAPASGDTLPGQDSFIQLAGPSADEMLLVRDIAMPLNFGPSQRRKMDWQSGKGTYPTTRMGMAAQLRQAFLDALDYQQKVADYEKRKGEKGAQPVKRDLKLEALLPYLEGKKTIVLAASDASDLQTAVKLANDFHLKFVLNHVTHSRAVLDYIAGLKAPVIVGPIYDFPKDNERYDAVYGLPGELVKRGVKIAFASYDSHQVRNLPYAAGYAVAYGLPYDEAMKALTINAAEIWGLADKFGSLDAGKVANVVVADGDPLDVRTDVKHVFVNGQEIPIWDRQMELRDQYAK